MRIPDVRRVTAGGAEIAFESFGEGVPLVAIHGFPPDRRLMIGCLEPCFGLASGTVRCEEPLAGSGDPSTAE